VVEWIYYEIPFTNPILVVLRRIKWPWRRSL
jgi:hypothetical protein